MPRESTPICINNISDRQLTSAADKLLGHAIPMNTSDAHSEQAVVAHACPGQGEKGGVSTGGPPALAGTREYEQSDRNR